MSWIDNLREGLGLPPPKEDKPATTSTPFYEEEEESPATYPPVPAYTPQATKESGAESLDALKYYAAENGYYIDTGTSGDAPRFYRTGQLGKDEYGYETKNARVEVDPSQDPFAKALLQQYQSYTRSAAGKGAAGGGSGSGAAAKYVDPILAYMNSGEFKMENARSDEVSRQMKDAITRLNALYSYEDSDQAYQANAIQANLAQEKAWRSGQADWESPGARTMIGSRPHREEQQALQDQLALSLPDTILPDYGLAGLLGMEGRQGFDDKDFDFGAWYAEGTRPLSEIRRFADGTFSNNPFLSIPMPYIPGSIQGVQTGNVAAPGMYNSNQFLPASQQQYGGQEWDAATLATMLKNIKEGRAGMPTSWAGPDLSQWSGQDLPPSVVASLSQYIQSNPGELGLTSMMGARPGDRGNAYTTMPLTPQEQQAMQINDLQSWLAVQNHGLSLQKYLDSVNAAQGAGGGGGGGGGIRLASNGSAYQTTYGGSYSGGASEGDPDLDEKLALEYAKLKLQEELGRGELEESKLNGIADRAYKDALAGNIKDQHDLNLLKFAEDQLNNTWTREHQTAVFEEQKKQAEREAQQRQQQLEIERGGKVAALGANPGDAVQRQFFLNQGTEPVGESQDAFTGASTGQKTLSQIQQEDAPKYWANAKRPTLQTMAGGGPIRDPMFITGDARSGRPTGNEEVVLNWTGAPLDVVNNRDAVAAGWVPPAPRKRGR